jgi:hypothetical protein
MEFGDVESCVQDFSDLGAEYKVLEVSVLTLLALNDAARMFILCLSFLISEIAY